MASNDSIDEQKIGEDMKGIVCGLIWCIILEQLSKTTKNINKDSCYSSWDSNQHLLNIRQDIQ
jgi:hypothetical protein